MKVMIVRGQVTSFKQTVYGQTEQSNGIQFQIINFLLFEAATKVSTYD